jgi:acetyltransferase EpsM
MARPLVVLGGGEHARVVIEAASTIPGAWHVAGLTDPRPAERTVALTGVTHLGDDDSFALRYGALEPAQRPLLVLGMGLPDGAAVRRKLASRFGSDLAWAVVVHRDASVSPSASLGPGTVVFAGAVVQAGAVIGRHVIVNSAAVVEHDVQVGDRAHVAPGAVVGGGAVIGEDAFVGLGALVRDHVIVGAGATVGMGAVVVADVPPNATVMGNPARVRDDG